MKSTQVIAVIVVFQPELEALYQLVLATAEQVEGIVIVNNSPKVSLNDLLQAADTPIHLITLEENMGIAYAQNIGIEWAISQNAQYVLLLDQDSTPLPGMVQTLAKSFDCNSMVIAAGPQYQDFRTGVKSRFMVERFGLPYRLLPKNSDRNKKSLAVKFLISSGCLINLDKLLKIGGMRSNYFIDHVDTEWCLRAINSGYVLLGCPNALMQHTLGDQAKKVWFIYTRNISQHSPLRDYYMFRNTLLMLRDTKAKFAWRTFLVLRLFQFLIYFSLFSAAPLQRLKMMLLGIKHGLQNKRGQLDPNLHCCVIIPPTPLDPQVH